MADRTPVAVHTGSHRILNIADAPLGEKWHQRKHKEHTAGIPGESVEQRVTRMFYFKGCSECQGDMVLDEDLYGTFLKCLRCGRQVDVEAREPGQSKETARGKSPNWLPSPLRASRALRRYLPPSASIAFLLLSSSSALRCSLKPVTASSCTLDSIEPGRSSRTNLTAFSGL